jgi:pullulanase/glycogen debranching enzyme
VIGELASRLTGSSDLFGRRRAAALGASINFVTAHDGFTLHDLVSYNHKHNEANGEDNRDGRQQQPLSWNCGVEGPTDDPEDPALRARQKRNLLATLLLSQGVPMLLAGDEFGRTQHGNNNAYCQDNELLARLATCPSARPCAGGATRICLGACGRRVEGCCARSRSARRARAHAARRRRLARMRARGSSPGATPTASDWPTAWWCPTRPRASTRRRARPERGGRPARLRLAATTDWRGRPWHEAVIYELHVGTFTPEGTFARRARNWTSWPRSASPRSS